jgi:hypothetical protein
MSGLDTIEGPKGQLDDVFQSLTLLKDAYNHNNHCLTPINIFAYFPQSKNEIDIQLFNLREGRYIPNHLQTNEDIAIMVEKLNKRRESGRLRAQKWYDLHKDNLKEQRLLKKLEKKEMKKKTVEEKKEPMRRGRKIKPIEVTDIINGLIKI